MVFNCRWSVKTFSGPNDYPPFAKESGMSRSHQQTDSMGGQHSHLRLGIDAESKWIGMPIHRYSLSFGCKNA